MQSEWAPNYFAKMNGKNSSPQSFKSDLDIPQKICSCNYSKMLFWKIWTLVGVNNYASKIWKLFASVIIFNAMKCSKLIALNFMCWDNGKKSIKNQFEFQFVILQCVERFKVEEYLFNGLVINFLLNCLMYYYCKPVSICTCFCVH